jgi:hypothetical protein
MLDQYNFAVAVPGDHYIYNVFKTRAEAEKVAQEAKKENNRPYQVIDDLPKFWQNARQKFLTGPEKIDAARYWELLEVLPPLQFINHENNVRVFCMSEFTWDDVTTQVGQIVHNGGYLYATKPVVFNDRETYLTRDEIIKVNM